MLRRVAASAVIGLILIPIQSAPADAQSTLGGRTDLTFASAYVWRGRSTGRAEIMFDIMGSLRSGNAYTTIGVWTLGLPLSLDESRANRVSLDPTELVPLENELDLWVEHARAYGGVRVAAGFATYLYNEFIADSDDPKEIPNTSEVYARLEYASIELGYLHLTPKVVAWYDVDKVKGAYFETSLVGRLPAWPNAGIYLGAVAGWSAGQSLGANEIANFAEDGLTHVDFSLALPFFVLRSVSYSLAFHYQVNVDDFTRRTNDCNACNRETIWLDVAISYSF